MTRGTVMALAFSTACSGAGEGGSEAKEAAFFPENYQQSYVEVRGCRKSGDHDLAFVRVLADEDAAGPYLDRTSEFSEASVVLKEEYDFGDATCSGELLGWTAMRRNAAATEQLGWDWQRVSSQRTVTASSTGRCQSCHAACTGSPGVGYVYTCTEP